MVKQTLQTTAMPMPFLKTRRDSGRMSLNGTKKLSLLRAFKVLYSFSPSDLSPSVAVKKPLLISINGNLFAALISWAFPPAIILGMAFNVPVWTESFYCALIEHEKSFPVFYANPLNCFM